MMGIILAFTLPHQDNRTLFAAIGLACTTTLFGTLCAAISYLLSAYHQAKVDELIQELHSRFLEQLGAQLERAESAAEPP